MNKTEFIQAILPSVLKTRAEGSFMFPSCRIAQNILETGCNIHPWFNLGGIKAGKGKPNAYWKGETVHKGTWEVYNGVRENTTADFRAYASLYDFYKDQDIFLSAKRYAPVVKATSPEEQAERLRQCGYATDPEYAIKIKAIIQANNLKQYDVEVKPVEKPNWKETAMNFLRDEKLTVSPHDPDSPVTWAEFGIILKKLKGVK